LIFDYQKSRPKHKIHFSESLGNLFDTLDEDQFFSFLYFLSDFVDDNTGVSISFLTIDTFYRISIFIFGESEEEK